MAVRVPTGWTLVAVAAVGGLLAGSVAGAIGGAGRSGTGACDVVAVADRGLPSVVTVSAVSADADEGAGTGSGAVIRDDGYVLTNDHVIALAADGGSLGLRYADGTVVAATLVGRDIDTDVAVLKAADGAVGRPVMPFGSSAELKVGQPVIALGAPLGLSSTVTAGIVSALGRQMTLPAADGASAQLVGSVQTDASINPGNSGGPLVDCDARLVGVNTAIITVPLTAAGGEEIFGGGSVGLGFAIPSELAERLADEIIATGRVAHPTFGMTVYPINAEIAAATGLTQGVIISAVDPQGPAAQAGLRRGDLIVALAGDPTVSADSVVTAVLTRAAGDAVEVTFVRAGARDSVEVVLAPSA